MKAMERYHSCQWYQHRFTTSAIFIVLVVLLPTGRTSTADPGAVLGDAESEAQLAALYYQGLDSEANHSGTRKPGMHSITCCFRGAEQLRVNTSGYRRE